MYHRSLGEELLLRGAGHESELAMPLLYKGKQVGDGLRLDLWVEKVAVVRYLPLILCSDLLQKGER